MRLTRSWLFLPTLLPTLLLAGCPHPTYMVADVTTETRSIRDALVATDCGESIRTANRTDEEGRARVQLWRSANARDCLVTVAKPGYETIEQRGVNLCSSAGACPPTRYILRPVGGDHE